jgi:hypothetical protein
MMLRTTINLLPLCILVLSACAVALPAYAQQPGGQGSPEERALQSQAYAATNRETMAIAEVLRLRDENASLKAELTKLRQPPPASPSAGTEEKKE